MDHSTAPPIFAVRSLGRAAPPRLSGAGRVWALTAVLASTAAALLLTTVVGLPDPSPGKGLPWWAFIGAFAATEVFVVHLHVRGDAHSFSLSEIPLVVGLLLTGAVGLVAARVLGAGIALVVHRRQTGLKLAFNLAHFVLEAALAVTMFHLFLGGHWAFGPRAWGAAFVAVTLVDAYAALAVTAAISLMEGRLQWRSLVEVLAGGAVAAVTNTSLALVASIMLVHDARAAALLVVMAVILFLAYRAYLSVTQRNARLQLLYGFTRAVGSAVDAEELTRIVLAESMDVLRAGRTELVLLAEDGTPVKRVALGPEGIETSTSLPSVEKTWWRATVDGEVAFLPKGAREGPERHALVLEGRKDGMAAPLRGERGVFAVLVVSDRLGDVSSFDDDDRRLLETLANHAGVALQNGRLVDRLRTEAAEKEHQSLHDSLTGLSNRSHFNALVDAALRRAPGAGLAVLLLDLDRFKEVNDALGHGTGDRLLEQVARRLELRVGPGSSVARLGGDEFAVLVPALSDPTEATLEAAALLRALAPPFEVDGIHLQVGASVGIAIAPGHGSEASLLLQRADVAMYNAKAAGNEIEVYAPERDQHTPRRVALLAELRDAVAQRQLEVHYQPQADFATGRVTGVEALVRWPHPSLGMVQPDEFVPLAERTGLITPLTLLVLEDTLRQSARWRRAGTPLDVSVNLSARTLVDADFPADVARLLHHHEVRAGSLTLEITESSIMGDLARTTVVLDRLHGLGVRLSIDDFGTGYSSLAYLKRLPVDEMKIDKSFVFDVATDADDEAIVRSTVDLAHNLGLHVVAEGVETPAIWSRLVDLGCDTAQGYLLSRPLPAAAFDAWLANRASAGSELESLPEGAATLRR